MRLVAWHGMAWHGIQEIRHTYKRERKREEKIIKT
jgi:hypothetical protein